ncbi:ABC transporter ATP-binding protein [Desulfosporosinus shakirovi]|uniref:ABC transporter ATP-binding protein n=1 Tax=Desulfosporosinus shakirovi TaxID=2885154 RepID=UPI001E63AFD4|nr:ABC transporter ATP-binding protein [Desulfosporosinus sp. SRJS8]MCB8818591.1 ABC transporter ATP-binding protein [Desulfosporosinus sp. SRJS8]
MNAILANELTKYYGKYKALDAINLEVHKGEVFGFIGPNGAGKSTTIRILLGLLRKNGGKVALLGGDPWKDAVELHRRMAYVPSDVNLWPNLTGGEVIDLLARLRGELNKSRRAELLERFELDPTKKCRTYSKGNRQKVAIIAAFVSDVELFILDEPTTGLDPLMEAVFQQYITEAKQAGKTILLSSHILAEVEALCDRVSIIKGGKIVESGTLNELRHLTRTSISVETKKTVSGLTELPGVHEVKADGLKVKFSVDPMALDAVLHHLTQFGVCALNSAPPTLEELFMRHYSTATK